MDLEGYARRRVSSHTRSRVKEELISLLKIYKNLERKKLGRIADAVLDEVARSGRAGGRLFDYHRSNVAMGEMGVGSRGAGDIFVHREIARLTETKNKAVVSPKDQDDAGVVRRAGRNIVVSVDGTHSRLSDFPFLAGFHVARASARDVFVMGARPLALFCDLHLSDDGDVSKLFDFMAGVSLVSSHLRAPIISGSTLRVGGDMVIGDRMVSGVGCLGMASRVWARRFAKEGDVLLMTSGAGGGTITTAAIYSGFPDVVPETINLDFACAAEALLGARGTIHAVTDVTNGGLRGDCLEIARTAGVGIFLEEEKIGGLVNARVRAMLETLRIDYLGVSLDALLIVCPPSSEKKIRRLVQSRGIAIERVGHVERGNPSKVFLDGREMKPRFRESAYTQLKKVYGEATPRQFEEMKRSVALSRMKAQEKIRYAEGLLAAKRRRLH